MNLGTTEIILILVIALIVFGDRLPKLARNLRQSLHRKSDQPELPPLSARQITCSVLAVVILVVVAVADFEHISSRQIIISLAVFASWLTATWFCFSPKK